MSGMDLTTLFLSFLLYSMLGWLYESTLCSIVTEHRFINRGFLIGPYCPVYGVGAVSCYLFFAPLENPLAVMGCSMVLCSVIEYITGYGMEKLFHAKWWDYSDLPFQLHGRICLYGALIFGLANVVICKAIQPLFLCFTASVPFDYLRIIVCLTAGLFLSDLTMTLISWSHLNRNLDVLYQVLMSRSNDSMGRLSEHLIAPSQVEVLEEKWGIQVRMQNWNMKLKRCDLRFFHAFPRLIILRFENIPQRTKIKETISHVFRK